MGCYIHLLPALATDRVHKITMLEETRNEVQVAEVTYCLRHLAPTSHYSTVMLPGDKLKDLPVEVGYTMHCWTRGLRERDGETIDNVPATHLFMDGKEPRLFCQRRYSLSLQLPDLMKKVLAEHPSVYLLKTGNHVNIETMEELADGTLVKITYYIILHLRKHAPLEQRRVIKLRVETAFPEDLENYERLVYDPKGKNLEVILRELWLYREGAPKPGKGKPKKKK